jgi:hypothetical protein
VTNSPSVVRTVAEPRVCSYPGYRYSHVDDVVDQADLAGLFLDPWQRMVLRHAVGERPDGKWSAFEVALIVSRQNGKGAILEARELAGLFLFDEELILHSAHEYRTAMEAFRRIVACVRRMARRVNENLYDYDGIPIKVINTNGEEGLERLDTGQRLQFIARSKNAGRGFTADLLVWDEAYALLEDQVDAQMPTLSARPNTQIWYTSSPPLDAMTGAQLFRVRRRALAGATDALAYFDYGAPGTLDDLSGVNLDDRELWAATNPAYPYRISEEAIQRERASMTPHGFARERLGIWPPDLDQADPLLPSLEQWRALADRAEPDRGQVAFAIEVTWDRLRSAIVAIGPHPDGARRTVDVIAHEPGTDWIVPKVRELHERWNPLAWGLAAGGPAAALLQPLADAGIVVPTGEPTRGQLWVPSSRDLGAACGSLVDAVRHKTLTHRDDPRLNDALASARTRPLGDTWMFARKASGDISALVATAVGLAAYEARKHLARQSYDALSNIW